MAKITFTLATAAILAPAAFAAPASNQTAIDTFWKQGMVGSNDAITPKTIYGTIFSGFYDETTGRCDANGPHNPFNIGSYTCTNIPGTNCIEVTDYNVLQHMTVCNTSGCTGICNSLNNLDVHAKNVNGAVVYVIPTPGTNSINNDQQ